MVAFILVKPPLKQHLLKHTNLNPWMPICFQNELTRCLNTLYGRTYLAIHFHCAVVLNISGFSAKVMSLETHKTKSLKIEIEDHKGQIAEENSH